MVAARSRRDRGSFGGGGGPRGGGGSMSRGSRGGSGGGGGRIGSMSRGGGGLTSGGLASARPQASAMRSVVGSYTVPQMSAFSRY